MVLYEYPLNESIRTLLRLDHLHKRLGVLVAREAPVDHHYALATLFEIADVASRADLRAELLRELDRQRQQLNAYRGNPSISEQALDHIVGRIDDAYDTYNQTTGKPGQSIAASEWLSSLRSRIGIPGGTFEFDLPAYHEWQQRDAESRRADLQQWSQPTAALAVAVNLALKLLRDAGVPHKVMARAGQYQQSLPSHRTYQLMRVRIENGVIPEITGHRLLVAVRLMRQEGDGRLKPLGVDAGFELALCV